MLSSLIRHLFGHPATALATVIVSVAFAMAATPAAAQATVSKNLAAGFSQLPKDSTLVILPVDVELFSLSAGGVPEPRADWTTAAVSHMGDALGKQTGKLGLAVNLLNEKAADEFGEQIGLHAAVARSIALHHSVGGVWALPTKAGVLDWSFGDAMQPLQQRVGARYGLFVWVRDSYASAERKAAMVALAILGVGLTGGSQVGYASLVDLDSGRVLWFNRLARSTGDLREAGAAAETIQALLSGFPVVK